MNEHFYIHSHRSTAIIICQFKYGDQSFILCSYKNESTMLANGEQTKILLAVLFLKENAFLLIDKPTNHLDVEGRQIVCKYLSQKKGFILVSHDRDFLDTCIEHILSINKNNSKTQKANFSS